VRFVAKRKHAFILELNGATETRIKNINAVMRKIAALIRAGEWRLDFVVVVGRIQARQGFAAISQAAGQALDVKAVGDPGLRGLFEFVGLDKTLDIGAELLLASGWGASGYSIYEFGSRETPIFTHTIRVKQSLWSRLLPGYDKEPWLIDPAGGRRDLDTLLANLSHLPPEARRYNPQYSAMAPQELAGIADEDLFEEVASLPDEHGSEVAPNLDGSGGVPSNYPPKYTPEQRQQIINDFGEYLDRHPEERQRLIDNLKAAPGFAKYFDRHEERQQRHGDTAG
jgi:hypothetical protein